MIVILHMTWHRGKSDYAQTCECLSTVLDVSQSIQRQAAFVELVKVKCTRDNHSGKYFAIATRVSTIPIR